MCYWRPGVLNSGGSGGEAKKEKKRGRNEGAQQAQDVDVSSFSYTDDFTRTVLILSNYTSTRELLIDKN